MIEILFSESAAGSMKLAKSPENTIGSSTSLLILKDDGTEPTAGELAREQAKMEEEYRIKRENAIPMEGTPRDVACFPLSLSTGSIREPFSDARADYLQSQVLIGGADFANIGRELMQTARISLERLRSAQEPLRIWYSRSPDEFCGFCHILTVLPKDADIRVVELPDYEVIGSEIRTYSGWGELDPYELGRFQALERPLMDPERRRFTGLWRELQSENGALRAVVNGKLCTVPSDFYDAFLLRELEHQPKRFHQARFIGQILGKYPLGLSDSFIALRMETFISQGMLTPISEPPQHRPIYHRFLEKNL